MKGTRADRAAGDFNPEGVTYGAGTDLNRHQSPGHADSDGLETISAYRCAPGCPGAELDRQSGERSVPSSYVQQTESGGYGGDLGNVAGMQSTHYGDTGGASRFFYTAKASRSERNAGLEGFEEGDRVFMGSGGADPD